MVNLLQNITALAGAATTAKIFDFENHVVNLNGNLGIEGQAIMSFPETPGAPNENWLITPTSAGDGTFTVQSAAWTAFSISYAGAIGSPLTPLHSPVVASSKTLITFRMETVGAGPTVNFIDAVTGDVLTAWSNSDPQKNDPATPLTMEHFSMPKSFMQSFTIQLVT